MNVKNIYDFLDDIEKYEIKNWYIEDDCHEKVKKITLEKKGLLTEKELTETIQITLENNPLRRRGVYGRNPRKQWELPADEGLPEQVKIVVGGLKSLKGYPVYDGAKYYGQEEVQ